MTEAKIERSYMTAEEMAPHILRAFHCAVRGASKSRKEELNLTVVLAVSMLSEVLYFQKEEFRTQLLLDICAKVKKGAEGIEKEYGKPGEAKGSLQ